MKICQYRKCNNPVEAQSDKMRTVKKFCSPECGRAHHQQNRRLHYFDTKPCTTCSGEILRKEMTNANWAAAVSCQVCRPINKSGKKKPKPQPPSEPMFKYAKDPRFGTTSREECAELREMVR